jgi:hypothetical protein
MILAAVAVLISSATHNYTLHLGGTEDAANTRDPIVYPAWKPGYEPMRSVKLENVGDTDVVNPWLTVNGKGDWRTVKLIVREALGSYGNPASDRDKARAIWEWMRLHRFHATTGDLEVRDPVKLFNVYGFGLCGDVAPVLMELWRNAGIPSRRGYPIGHCVAEAWYDGGWHMLDSDESVFFLDRDNRTILPEKAVARDHDLARRAYASNSIPTLYDYDGTHTGDFPSHEQHAMDFILRPGESIEWLWGQGTKFHYAPNPVLYTLDNADLHRWGANAWATLRNGKWIYKPRTAGPWKIRTPYVIVGGHITGPASVSLDGREWKPVPADGSIDFLFPSPGAAVYEFWVRSNDLPVITADLQMAPLAMPSLSLGENRVQYTDQGQSRSVRLTFDYVERSSSKPPAAPAGHDLQWSAVTGAAAYHFELSEEPTIRWTLSPAFSVVQAGTKFVPVSNGLLNPGQTYYCRVRAKSDAGIWGPWSLIWTVKMSGPNVPKNVRWVEREPEKWTLVWDGDAPRYRVYASDEKGFSIRNAVETADMTKAFYRVVAIDADGRESGPSDYAEAPRPWIYSTPPRTAKVGIPYRYEAKTVRSKGDETLRHVPPGNNYKPGFWDPDVPVFSIDKEMPKCGNFDAKWLEIDSKTGVLTGIPTKNDVGEYQINVKVEIRGKVHVQSFPLRVE